MKEKLSNIFKWFTEIGNVIKTVAAVITLGGLLIGGIKIYNASVINKHEKEIRDSMKEADAKTILIKLDSLNLRVGQIKEGQKHINTSIEALSGTVGILKQQVGIHIVNTATKEDIINWMNAFEKKNETSAVAIPYNYNKK
jgi:hypothetical protein